MDPEVAGSQRLQQTVSQSGCPSEDLEREKCEEGNNERAGGD